ncbi:MAG: FtsX-like permease family protein [Thermonemataceae bacterium]|nr:FtsX-like permease family protein [Thermonemataceae bacterium]
MNLNFWIANKYFLSKKKNLFINIISGITVLVISISTASFIILLSVFNGLEDMIRLQFSVLNPDLKISPKKGKIFTYTTDLQKKIGKTQGISYIAEVIEDDAVFKYKDRQMIGKVKGVSENFAKYSPLSKQMKAGEFRLYEDDYAQAVLGLGVFSILTMNYGDAPLEIWYPNRKEKITMSEKDINQLSIFPSGVFEVEYEHDSQYVIVPIEFCEKLMNYNSQERSFLEIGLKNQENVALLQKNLKEIFGDNFEVLTREEQQMELLRAIRTEKLFTRMALSFVFGIACFNIFFLLTMITLEKNKDIAIWQVLGANKSFIKKIFIYQALLIIGTGVSLGSILGVSLAWLQQNFGFVKMNANSLIESYPIRMDWKDFMFSFVTIFIVGLLIAYFPAHKSVKASIKDSL